MAAAAEAHRSVWSRENLRELRESLVANQVLPKSTSLEALTAVLIEHGELRSVELQPMARPAAGDGPVHRPKRRLVWGNASAFDVALSLRPRSYLSHGSAAAVHGLVTADGQQVHVNQEQSPKPAPAGRLEQGAIDRAFANRGRTSTYRFRYDNTEIVLLNGKHTGDYGVIEIPSSDGPPLRATALARTLVDIAVRPTYTGGPRTVLSAYRVAVNRLATAEGTLAALVAEVSTTLDALGHIYPYHQAVGFYLDRAEAPDEMIRPLLDRGLSFDFYLDYAMKSPDYDPLWRVHYPRALI